MYKLTAPSFVAAVFAVGVAVAKEVTVEAHSVATGQLVGRAHGLEGAEKRASNSCLRVHVAVVHLGFEIANLAHNVEQQSR